MGGINETHISNLRIHIKDGPVSDRIIHLHDDVKNLKFEMDIDLFKKEVKACFEALNKKDGLVEIKSGDNTLCIIKRKKIFSILILDKTSIKQKFNDYLKDC